MKIYEEEGQKIGKLVDKKNHAYGDSFRLTGAILKILYPKGVKPEQYDDMLAVARVLDKIFRIATDRDALGENPWVDIAGYAILRARQLKEKPEE
jgi:hypothetical protein